MQRGDTQTHQPLQNLVLKKPGGSRLWADQGEVANSSIHAKHHGCRVFVGMTEQLPFTWSWRGREAGTWQSLRATTSRSLSSTCCCSKDIKLIEAVLKPSVFAAFIWVWIITSSSNLNVKAQPRPVKMKWFLNSSQKVHICEGEAVPLCEQIEISAD